MGSVRAVVWIYLPLIAAAVAWNLHGDGVSAAGWGICLGAGLALWTLLEYLLHRFAFHRLAPHYRHHEFPTERRYIFAPLWFSLSAAAVLFGILGLAAGSWAHGALVEAGIVVGYLCYEVVHIWIHSPRSGGVVLTALRRHHYYHHFADDTKCYGVTSPLWDRVFGSIPEARSAGSELRHRV
jgi:sterol desaturase/sphingolipid hydroxylase (fatty acid hydroxylase superfamily)